MLGLGIGLASPAVLRGLFDLYDYENPEAFVVVSRMVEKPDSTRKGVIDDLVGALKAASVWAKMDVCYVLAAHNSQASLVNWKGNPAFRLVVVGSPTFETDRGWTTPTTADSLPTGFFPGTHGVQYTLNSAHQSVRSRTSGAAAGAFLEVGGGSTATTRLGLCLRSNTGNLTGPINDGTNSGVANTDGSGHFVQQRISATHRQFYRNGAQVGSDVAVNSTSITATQARIGGWSAMSRQWSSYSLGAHMSAVEIGAFEDAELAYMTAVGAA